MPHDKVGRQIQDGDIVTLKAKITGLCTGETDCNGTFNIIIPDGVGESYAPSFAGNTKLGEVDPADARDTVAPHPSVAHVLQFFAFAHLPAHLRAVSEPFHRLACRVANLPTNAETTVALRKLLEAKDAAVRALLSK